MKIYKPNEHSLLIKPFGIQNTLHLACTVLVFYDLSDPGRLLSEQELWKTIPDELGPNAILDMGMPKPNGEVLLTGQCFAPRGATRPASEVSFRVGRLQKRLHIFGHRFWKPGTAGQVVTDPEPFQSMPIAWDHAFGGEGFEKNPLGKGLKPVTWPDGRSAVALPNIEDPGHLIGSISDRPGPAGMGPIDPMWPQRAKKQGTYDAKWQRERWPYFPDDMDYGFFNTAPDDQVANGFFTGDEAVEIVNMHPDAQLIQSRLPGVRIRCFVTRKQPDASGGETFAEVKTRIDTVWLFPHLLRGVVMFRGTTEIRDDEYADVLRILTATESLDDPPASLDHYLEEQKKRMDRSVPIDQAPLEAAKKKIDAALRTFKKLPKEIEAAKNRAMGKTPRQPLPDVRDKAAASSRMIAGSLALLDKLETRAKAMHAQYGHVVRVPLEQFSAHRVKLGAAQQRSAGALAKLEKTQQRSAALRKELSAAHKAKFKLQWPESADTSSLDALSKPKQVNPWHDRGFPFVLACRRHLHGDPDLLRRLGLLGFEPATIRRAWLGYNAAPRTENPGDWGLASRKDDQGQPASLALPAGLVLPRFDATVLNRILIRPDRFSQAGSDRLVEGSDETPLFMQAATLIDLPGRPAVQSAPVVCLADEFQALLVEQEIGDICSVVTLKERSGKIDAQAAAALEKAPILLVVLPEGGIAEGEWAGWEKTFPNARALSLPKGDTVFAARQGGTDLRRWILEALPAQTVKDENEAAVASQAGQPPGDTGIQIPPLPLMDVKKVVQGLLKEIRDFHQPKFDALRDQAKAVEGRVKAAMEKAGQDPAAAAQGKSPTSFSEAGSAIAKKINSQKQLLRSQGKLTPEMETRMDEAARQFTRMGARGDTRYQEGVARIAEGKSKIAAATARARAGEAPPTLKEKLKGFGFDPDKRVQRTREEVIDMHARGESLAGAILSDLDLSELDLHGIDLSGAQCQKTNFGRTRLEGADLSEILAKEADFTGAVLKEMRSRKGIFTKACFKQADLSGADLSSVAMQKADLSGADCTGVRLHMTTLQKATLLGAVFDAAEVNMTVFSDADASNAGFCKARLTKCLFRKTVLNGADFSGANLDASMFFGARGTSVRFAGADMSKSRMGGRTSLTGADFSGVRMKQGCFRDSDLSGANFQGARIEGAMLEGCDLTRTNLAHVSCIKSRLAKSDLEGADMRGINLFLGSLRKARLVKTDLRGANLYGVDFYKAVMGETRLEEANLKMTLLQGRTEYLP